MNGLRENHKMHCSQDAVSYLRAFLLRPFVCLMPALELHLNVRFPGRDMITYCRFFHTPLVHRVLSQYNPVKLYTLTLVVKV